MQHFYKKWKFKKECYLPRNKLRQRIEKKFIKEKKKCFIGSNITKNLPRAKSRNWLKSNWNKISNLPPSEIKTTSMFSSMKAGLSVYRFSLVKHVFVFYEDGKNNLDLINTLEIKKRRRNLFELGHGMSVFRKIS